MTKSTTKIAKISVSSGFKQVTSPIGKSKNKEVLIERVMEKGFSSTYKVQQKNITNSIVEEPLKQSKVKKD